jgi:DNA-binding transcriptional ArsR family regulator
MCDAKSCHEKIDEVLVPEFFKALCDPSRLAILIRLLEKPELSSVSGLADEFGLDVSVVSRHLATLREAGILNVEKRGRESCHLVNTDLMVNTLKNMAAAVESCCGAVPSDITKTGQINRQEETTDHERTESTGRCITGVFKSGY